MKAMILAVLAVLAGGTVATAPATAQHRVVVERRVVHRTVTPRRWHQPRRVCTTRWHHGHRVRRCVRR